MNRLIGIDVARALALFGMVIVNFKLAMGADNGQPLLLDFTSLFEGRASALFVILAGVGIALLSKKALISGALEDIRKARISLIKRALLLIVIGLAFTPIWEADILRFYGFYFLIAAFLFTMTNKALLFISIGFVLAFPLLWAFFDYEKGWDWLSLSYSGFWTIYGMFRHLLFNGYHPVFPWCGFLLFGMWLGRQDLTSTIVRKSLFIWSLSALVLIETSFYLLRVWAGDGVFIGMSQDEIDFVMTTSIIPPLPQYMLSAASSAVLILLACLKLGSVFPSSRVISFLSNTGQLTLTLYVAHVVIGMGVLEATGLLNNQSIQVSLLATLVFSLASIVFSVFWLKHFQTGPLEWVFKKLTRAL
jgi:uncharacterized membrane protein YeiB